MGVGNVTEIVDVLEANTKTLLASYDMQPAHSVTISRTTSVRSAVP